MNRRHLLAAAATPLVLAAAAHAQLQPAWTIDTGKVTLGSPKLADINGDGALEIIVPTAGISGNPYNEGNVYVLDRFGLPLPGWPVTIDRPIFSAVAVGDIDGDGLPELVAQAWYNVWAWHHDGSPVAGWPRSTGAGTSNAPVLADLDGDGVLDVIYTAGNTVRAEKGDGTPLPGWPRSAAENFQTPAVGDIDGDGFPEVVAGTWRPNFPDPVTYELHAWNHDGAPLFTVEGLGSIRGAVSMGDLDGDGHPEIVVRAGDTLHVFDHTGAPRPGWPVTPGGPIRNATPAIGDLDGDGQLEIVIAGYDLYAYKADGAPVPGYPATIPGITGNVNSSAVIADIDGDPSSLEAVVKYANFVFAANADGSTVPDFPIDNDDYNNTGTFSSSPAFGDLDGEGTIEYVFVGNGGRIAFFGTEHAVSNSLAQWPMAHFDARNTSFLTFGGGGPGCPADWDDDGAVNSNDISAFLTDWLASVQDGTLVADFDGSGGVNSNDISAFLSAWLDAVQGGC